MVGKQSKFLVWINYRVRVTIQDSRVLIGTFLAFDKHMNLVLSDTEEYTKIKAKKAGDVEREKKRSLGLVLLRGENIVSLSAESPPSQNSKRFSDIPNVGQGKSMPIGRGVSISTVSQAPSGLAGPGRGVGIPNMINMMPTMGRGMSNMPMNAPPNLPPMGRINPPNMPQPNMMNQPNMMPNIPMNPMMRPPPMMNPMMMNPNMRPPMNVPLNPNNPMPNPQMNAQPQPQPQQIPNQQVQTQPPTQN